MAVYYKFVVNVSTYEYILNFDADSFEIQAKQSLKVNERIWYDYRAATVKFVQYTKGQEYYIKLCKDGNLINKLEKNMIFKLIEEGFLTG